MSTTERVIIPARESAEERKRRLAREAQKKRTAQNGTSSSAGVRVTGAVQTTTTARRATARVRPAAAQGKGRSIRGTSTSKSQSRGATENVAIGVLVGVVALGLCVFALLPGLRAWRQRNSASFKYNDYSDAA